MKRVALLACALAAFLGAAQRVYAERWTESILWIEVNALRHNWFQPWSSSSRTVFKNGLAVGAREIVTTAEGLHNATVLRVRKRGRGRWWIADVNWIDDHANLAVLSVEDDGFWSSIPPAPLAERVPRSGPVRIGHFLEGRVESEPGTVRRVHVPGGGQRLVRPMMLEVTSDLGSGASSQIVAFGGEVIGLGAAGDGKRLEVVPAPLMAGMLAEKRRDPDAALAWYPFDWQGTQGPATAAYLGLAGPPRGIVVTRVPATSPFSGRLRPRDLILSIDGFGIESDGTYLDPLYGYLPFSALSTRGKFAGDSSSFEVWRDGKTRTLTLPLPRASYSDALVPYRSFDRSPAYLMAGGLVFQPLTTDYLRSWGEEWRKSAPFRLRYHTRQSPSPERRRLVVLSQVLPDAFNLGYRDHAFQIVDRINGRPIAALRDVEEALLNPREGFHLIEFLPARGPARLVLDSAGLAEATRHVMRTYGLPAARVIH